MLRNLPSFFRSSEPSVEQRRKVKTKNTGVMFVKKGMFLVVCSKIIIIFFEGIYFFGGKEEGKMRQKKGCVYPAEGNGLLAAADTCIPFALAQ